MKKLVGLRPIAIVLAMLFLGLVWAQGQEPESGTVVKRKKPVKIPPLEQPLNPPPRSQAPSPRPQPSPSPSPGPGPRPEPAPATQGTGVAAGVLQDKLGTDKYRDFVKRIEQAGQAVNAGNQGARGGCGDNFRCQDPWFDKAVAAPEAPVVRPQGNEFFRGGFTPPSPAEWQGTVREYGGQPGGGVVLEGSAEGLAPFEQLGYDGQFNALVFDARAVYFIRIPPRHFAELCRALARDHRVGVSLGQRRLVYGAIAKDSDIAFDLTLADRFLGDIVFAREERLGGYRFAGGYRPQSEPALNQDIAVFFRFRRYAFEIRGQEVVPAAGRVDVSLVPLSRQVAADGNLLPDFNAVDSLPPRFEQNARHVADNIAHYRREQIVQRAFIYGEVAALLRRLRDEGVDLDELADLVD